LAAETLKLVTAKIRRPSGRSASASTHCEPAFAGDVVVDFDLTGHDGAFGLLAALAQAAFDK
jgi:hypothetical protein